VAITIDNVRTLLQQMGAHIPALDAIIEESPGSWQLLFDDAQLLNLHFLDDESGLELVAVLGRPAADQELDVLRMLFCFQLIWRGGNQPRIALDAPSGSLLCLCQISPSLINTVKFEEAILAFWIQAKTLTDMVSTGLPPPMPAATPDSLHLHA